MKRTAIAGTFALLTGAVSLILLASIVYSCRQGGHPHDMGTQDHGSSSHSMSHPSSVPTLVKKSPSSGASGARARNVTALVNRT